MVTSIDNLRPKGVPSEAHGLLYAAHSHIATIWRWQAAIGKWYWVAAGNNGEEATERQAIDRAKRWIRDGQ